MAITQTHNSSKFNYQPYYQSNGGKNNYLLACSIQNGGATPIRPAAPIHWSNFNDNNE